MDRLTDKARFKIVESCSNLVTTVEYFTKGGIKDENVKWSTDLITHYIKDDFFILSEDDMRRTLKGLLTDLAERL